MFEWREGIDETRRLRLLENKDPEKLLCLDKHAVFEGKFHIELSMLTVIGCAKLRKGMKKNKNEKNNKCCRREEEHVITIVNDQILNVLVSSVVVLVYIFETEPNKTPSP